MAREYPYYPSFDGKKAQPGTEKLAELCAKRWKTKNLGIYQARLMRNSHTEGKKIGDPGMEKYLSVHATGAAVDLGYSDRKIGVEMWEYFVKYSEELGICEVHDYAYDANVKDGKPGYGRGYRCSRGPGAKGVKLFTAQDNAGSFGGMWIHVEISPEMAKNPQKLEEVFRSLKP